MRAAPRPAITPEIGGNGGGARPPSPRTDSRARYSPATQMPGAVSMQRARPLCLAFAALQPLRLAPMSPLRRTTRQSARLSGQAPAAASAVGAGSTPAASPAPKRRRKAAALAAAPPADPMALPAPLTRCTLVRRYKRFLADVELPGGASATAHCPNPGSMRGMGLDGRPDVLVSAAPPGSNRKLPYTLEAVQVDGRTWVGVNTQKPNAVVGAWLRARGADAVALFGEYSAVRPEVVYGSGGRSRVDFLLEYGAGEGGADAPLPFYVEVKNVTMLWDDGGSAAGGSTRVAVFPDSKTERGQKHLLELSRVVAEGIGRASVLYFVNRSDTTAFAPCTIDPKYVALFSEAKAAGVGAVPLVFDLVFDEASNCARFAFAKRLPVHPRPGP